MRKGGNGGTTKDSKGTKEHPIASTARMLADEGAVIKLGRGR